MNSKVELKFLRNLINAVFCDYSKTEIIESIYNNPDKMGIDLDCLSLIKIADKIRKKQSLTVEEIENIFANILPSIKNPQLDTKQYQLFLRYFITYEDPLRIFKYIINKEIFKELSFVMGIIIYNFNYYKNNDTFLVVYSNIKNKILKNRKANLLFFRDLFSNLITANVNYQKKNKIYELDDLLTRFITMNPVYYESLSLKQLKIFGSYAKKCNNEYSDLDLLIITNDTVINEISLSNYAKRVFEAELGISVDATVIRTNRTLDGFEKNIIKYAIDVPLKSE